MKEFTDNPYEYSDFHAHILDYIFTKFTYDEFMFNREIYSEYNKILKDYMTKKLSYDWMKKIDALQVKLKPQKKKKYKPEKRYIIN